MKIAIWHNLPSGGGKRALYYHVKGLKERGHVLESWCPPTADQKYLPLKKLINENIIELDYRDNNGLHPFAEIGKLTRFLKRIHALDQHCIKCASIIEKRGFDILFANSSLHICAPSIGRYISLPSIMYLQEPCRILYEALPQLPWIGLDPMKNIKEFPRYIISAIKDEINLRCRRYQAREELTNVKAFDEILANSYFSRESILRAYGLNSKVCYLGVDTDLFSPINIEKENVVIGLGSIRYEKNVKFIIEAVSYIRHNKPKLVWVANGYIEGYLSEIKKYANICNVDLIIKNNIEDDELVNILNKAKVLLYAPRLEPFGFAPLEANACGVPVIAVAEGGVRETIINNVNGLTVPHDPVEMSNAIMRLLQDDLLRKRLGYAGRDIVIQEWSIEKATDNIEKCLLDLKKI